MPRIRTLKPEVWESEQVGELSYQARLVFIGLITQADDEGRLKGSPKWIKGKLFPYDDVTVDEVEGWLSEVVRQGLVNPYKADDNPYLELPNWHRHQKINRKSQSHLPSPMGVVSRSVHGQGQAKDSQEGKGREGKGSRKGRETVVDKSPTESPLSTLLADLVADNDPDAKRPTVTDRWIAAEDRMVRIDKRSPLEAERLIRWCQGDEFWRGNVLSMPKFRDRYGQLYQAAVKAKRKATAKSSASPGMENARRMAEKIGEYGS